MEATRSEGLVSTCPSVTLIGMCTRTLKIGLVKSQTRKAYESCLPQEEGRYYQKNKKKMERAANYDWVCSIKLILLIFF